MPKQPRFKLWPAMPGLEDAVVEGRMIPTVRPANLSDSDDWLRMRRALWPEGSEGEHREEIERYHAGRFPRSPWMALVADNGGRLVGFAEVSIRPYAEGCRSHRVAYLEGWFVRPEDRGLGIGRALVEAAQRWGRDQGCTEMASDADPTNEISIAAHRALGFADAGLVRCFRKDLPDS